jgi:hypothetical protein
MRKLLFDLACGSALGALAVAYVLLLAIYCGGH